MSQLVAIAFSDHLQAEEARLEFLKLQKEYLVQLEDIVIVTKDEAGKIKLHQAISLTGVGAMSGGFWGMLIGVLFLSPVAGLAVGSAAGAISGALSDVGIDDQFMKDIGASLQPGTAALFILLRDATMDRVLERLEKFEGTVLKTSLSQDAEQKLREVLK